MSGDLEGSGILVEDYVRLHLFQTHFHHSLVQRWVYPLSYSVSPLIKERYRSEERSLIELD